MKLIRSLICNMVWLNYSYRKNIGRKEFYFSVLVLTQAKRQQPHLDVIVCEVPSSYNPPPEQQKSPSPSPIICFSKTDRMRERRKERKVDRVRSRERVCGVVEGMGRGVSLE